MKISIYHWGIFLLMLFSSCSTLKRTSQKQYHELEGSSWEIKYVSTSGEKRSHKIEFRSNGRLITHHPNERTPNNDSWEQEGNTVKISMNDSFANYTGEIVSASKMKGIASNSKDAEWRWSARKNQTEWK